MRLHATCVAVGGQGVLITGPSGCGKSDLALRLTEGGRDVLVADDYVELSCDPAGGLVATCPAPLQGLIEVRHIGVLKMVSLPSVPVALMLEPCGAVPERMPDPLTRVLHGVEIPCLRLPYLEASTPAKIRLFLMQGEIIREKVGVEQ